MITALLIWCGLNSACLILLAVHCTSLAGQLRFLQLHKMAEGMRQSEATSGPLRGFEPTKLPTNERDL